MSTKHSKAAAEFLKNKKQAAWHDETLWLVREKRDKLSKEVPEWEELRDMACATKLYSNSHLDELLVEFEANAQANGAHVHWAKDGEEYCNIVYRILEQHGVRHFIKSKSMLAEECELNPFLESKGIEVVESDLGERILQLMHLKPSHIVLPAIHIKREQVGKLFEKEMGTEKGNFDPTYLTHAARKNLRQKFIHAEAAMTGCNFAVASTGEVVVCTNEGNADMGVSQPKLQIAAFGIEKIVPDRKSLSIFTRLLARSATGQPITTYTSHYRKPRAGGEFHIILVDNGRSKILADQNHIKALNCIRCGACMNTCPVYRRSGGYSYTYFIPGPIGVNLGMLKAPLQYSDNVSACSLCYSCSNVCPAKVDLAEQIYLWRQDLDKFNKADRMKKMMSGGMKFIMKRPPIFNTALRLHKKYEKPELETLKKHALVYPDVIMQFQSMVKQVGGESHLLNKGEDINDIIIKAYPEAKRIASNISEISCATFNPDDVADPADLDGTDLAIVSGKIGVAENGAVWIEQDVKLRAVYFIAEKLVILLDKENIVNNMHEAYEEIDTGEYGFGVFISGPSKTADIEQALVMGAHGARDVMVILK